MPKKSPEVDAYIANSADFAKPILKKIRQLFHKASPKITESMKWSYPHFEYKGILGSMAAFKSYAGFGFWKVGLMNDSTGLLKTMSNSTTGFHRLTSLADMPPDNVVIAFIQQAIDLNEAGVKLIRDKKPREELAVPDDLAAALKKNKAAATTFKNFSYSHRKEYIEWITEAKRPQTRIERLATTIQQLAEGKSKHWKYQNC